MTRRPSTPWLAVAAAAVLPRLAVLAVERGDILAAFTEKGDDFARQFLDSGTYGFVPGEPSAWTQPLYGWFLIPVYWILGRHWWAVGGLQILVALGTASLVYAAGRRFVSPRAGLVAALVATLNPYLVWHDVHLNREILDQLAAAAIVYLTLRLSAIGERERGSRDDLRLALLLGVALGVGILGNTRLVFLPLVVLAFVLWHRRRAWVTAGAALAACAVCLLPWAIRNQVSVGCFTLGTDGRALWKANNLLTHDILASGKWIDDVPRLPGSPYTPEEAQTLYYRDHKLVHVDECAQMRMYDRLAIEFWRDHPGEKARLMAQAIGMLWDPRTLQTEGRPEAGGLVDDARSWVQPIYEIPLYLLAAGGLFLVPRRLAALIVLLLAYQTAAAMGFAGATRYRVPWDFALALSAGASLVWLGARARTRAAPARGEPAAE